MAVTYLALLRGINVGGKNKLPMKDLIAMFTAAECCDVRTFIQSGNVVFSAAEGIEAELSGLIAAQITRQFGYKVPVVLRTAAELGGVVRNNPFRKAGAPEGELHVLFLANLPAPRRVQDLDPNRSPPDAFAVRGREVYLRLPNGVAASKLTNAYFDSKLATTSTGRNWRTVTKLYELSQG
jgi:uncharacterized protein (DUF1697 family)